MYRNERVYKIRFTDADAYDNLKLSSLLSFMEESAAGSADELGFGYNALKKDDVAFIVVNWYIELYKPLKLGDELEIHTWPLAPKLLVFLRDFELFVGGEKVGSATSRWCMVNTKNYSTVPAYSYFQRGFFDGYNTERSVDFNSWKIPPCDGGKAYSKKAAYSDYDNNMHVNNTKYADILLDAFKVEDFKGKRLKTAQITYVKQCKEGETIDVYSSFGQNFIYAEGKVGDETRVVLKAEYDDV